MIGAIDIGGTKVAVGLVTPQGSLAASRSLPTAPLCARGAEGLRHVRDLLVALVRDAGEPVLSGVGIGCTGPVDPVTGIIGDVEIISGWSRLNLCEAFSCVGAPVAVENDADACALAESAWGAGRASRRFLYVTVSTGIGGGAVFDGRLYRGAGGLHPEIGHHVIDCAGPRCYCGARGCWEALASGPSLAARYAAQRPEACVADAAEVCRRALKGDETARHAVEREARYLGIGLANLTTLFAPDVIALGGGVMGSWSLFEAGVKAVMRESCTMVPADSVRIELAALGEELPLLGAACAWLHRYANAGG